MVDAAPSASAPRCIPCEESLDISTVAELRALLLQALEGKQPVVLEAAEITRIDTSALQVLVAFFQDARAQEIPVRWQAPSEVLRRSASLVGLTKLLELDLAA